MKRSRSTACIRAVLFDFDGTLTRPGALDFAIVKKEVGCPLERPVLEFIREIPDQKERAAAMAALDRFEMAGAENSVPNTGAEELIGLLKREKLPIGLISRNSRQAIVRALENFQTLRLADFQVVISRDHPAAIKPDPEGVLTAAEAMGVAPAHLMVVGDYWFDVEAGNRAGAVTAFLGRKGALPPSPGTVPTYTVESLSELLPVLELGIRLGRPLSSGKFPNELLREYLEEFGFEDPSVIINPGIGEDTAAVTVEGEEVLILKSDPITFVTDAVGHYAVIINANDIATSGADPRWMLTTCLFPVGITASAVFEILEDLRDTCKKSGITLCGGHTEITDAVTRPVISGTLAGTVRRTDLIDKRRMRPGDRVLLTKGVAVEGTSIIAREFSTLLTQKGFSGEAIRAARSFLSHISILAEARIARTIPGVSALHDVTEGGLATAVEELSIAGGHRIRIRMEAIPVYPETRQLCSAFGIDPLGLIGSGSLLICCDCGGCDRLVKRLVKEGIAVTPIGEVLEPGAGVEATENGAMCIWPKFQVDEITRLF